jgi:hypothetical protein
MLIRNRTAALLLYGAGYQLGETMGSHFVTLHACSLEQLRAWVGSRDRTLLNRIAGDERQTHEQALIELIDGTYDTEESERAIEMIRAFELLCKLASSHSVTIEMYDDEEESPLIWRLCWEGEDGIELPVSEEGTPAATYHSAESTQALLHEFEKLQKSGGYEAQYLTEESLAEIIKALEIAEASKSGIYGFVEY